MADEKEKVEITLEYLKAEHSQLVETIEKESFERGVKTERKRLMEIDSISQPGFEAIIAEAKEKGTDAKETAFKIMHEAQKRGITLAGIQKDSQDIPPAQPDESTLEQEKKEAKAKEQKATTDKLAQKLKEKMDKLA